jgi:2-polyprenyl-3-methyl-5-hydroxy-6-metoxy-1,4-benzoquinol methylase
MVSRKLGRIGGIEIEIHLDGDVADRLRRIKRAVFGAPPPPVPPADAAIPQSLTPEQKALLDQVKQTDWYHTIDLGHGIVTPGFFDHRPVLGLYHLPESMAGMRVLDVATYNGFWAFEFERRGAEVTGLDIGSFADIDLAPARRAQMTADELARETGIGFQIASRALQSRVRREICSVYDLSPERFGKFDLVFCGDLLLHLTNPVKALQRIQSVTGGRFVLSEMYDQNLDRSGAYKLLNYHGGVNDYVWWTFSLPTLEQMVRDAGFREVKILERGFDLVPRGYNLPKVPPHVVFEAVP